MLRLRERTGFPDAELLSVYRDHGVIRKRDRDDNFNKPGEDLARYQQVRCGDVVMNRMKAWQGSVGVSQYDGIVSPDYYVMEVIEEDVEARYLHHLLRSPTVVAEYGARSTGIRSNQWRLPWSGLADIEVTLPPIAEQRALARFIDAECARIDDLCDEANAVRGLADEWLRSHVSELLGVQHRAVPFGRYATLHRGFDLPSDEREPGDVPVVGSGGVVGVHLEAAVAPPAVVTGRYGSIGTVTWVDLPCWPLNTTLFVSDFKGNDPRFIYWALRALPLEQEAEKAAVPGLHRGDVHRLRLGAFTAEEQRSIAATLDAHEAELASLRGEIETQTQHLVEYRNALISDALAGRISPETRHRQGAVT